MDCRITRAEETVQCKKMGTALVRSPSIDPRYTRYRLEIRESKIHRRGVYALETIPAARKVIEYTGERIARMEGKRRSIRKLHYLFSIDTYWKLDGAVGGSGAEYINHSCEPNLRASIVKGHILYISKRKIAAGEELTVDYQFSRMIEDVPCRCGALKCRGTINLLR